MSLDQKNKTMSLSHETIAQLTVLLKTALGKTDADERALALEECKDLFLEMTRPAPVACQLSAVAIRKLNKMSGDRLHNYKKKLSAKLHYVRYDDDGKILRSFPGDIVALLNSGIACPGPSATERCGAGRRFDKIAIEKSDFKSLFKQFHFDHSYEQTSIWPSLDHAIALAANATSIRARFSSGSTPGFIAGRIKAALSDLDTDADARSAAKLNDGQASSYKLYKEAQKYINVDKLLHDVYGLRANGDDGGIRLLCPDCHNLVGHEPLDLERYVISPAKAKN